MSSEAILAQLQLLSQLSLRLVERLQSLEASQRALEAEIRAHREQAASAAQAAAQPSPLASALTDLVRQSGAEPWVRRMVGFALVSWSILALFWGLAHVGVGNTDALTLLFGLAGRYVGIHAPAPAPSP